MNCPPRITQYGNEIVDNCGSLPHTGANLVLWVIIGITLVALGVSLVAAVKK